ncbi:MAG: hypothetical protein Q7V15_04140 [Phenylobacterium sp.]|uniref:protein NO VEIN domain-containing protein n=1 Tax=Phenylobacterium sp. TaxID=1871053 RepID=UPI00271A0891|nr:DUF3883 domain-containing protein [Phenylobacterium sp.]MDO8900525.1 hypothetical protein [Phenylobacterium sp.]
MRYAVKLMTSSDLTLFAGYFRLHSSSKQKGTNLDSDVMASRLFPALPASITGTFEQPVVVDVYGPDGAPIHRVRRKIIKSEGSRNWRLNGKLIYGPDADPSRFDGLQAEDIAVFGFDGEPLPTSISMVLLSATSPSDKPIADYLRSTFQLAPRVRSMTDMSTTDLAAVPVPAGHPLNLLLPDPARTADLIAAAEDDEVARRRLDTRARSGTARPVSAAELAAAKARAHEVGRAGEALFCAHLERELTAKNISGFIWTADQNATSPYDFEVTELSGGTTLIDVKSTTSSFDGSVHISGAELYTAASSSEYRIARVFDLEAAGGPKVRVSEPIELIALAVRDQLATLPTGVRASKFEMHTDLFTWSEPTPLPSDDD